MLIVKLIEDYESIHHNLDDWEKSTPNELLRHIMTASGTHNVDLIAIIESSGVVSEVVNGKRTISPEQAKSLGKFFKLSPGLFRCGDCYTPRFCTISEIEIDVGCVRQPCRTIIGESAILNARNHR